MGWLYPLNNIFCKKATHKVHTVLLSLATIHTMDTFLESVYVFRPSADQMQIVSKSLDENKITFFMELQASFFEF